MLARRIHHGTPLSLEIEVIKQSKFAYRGQQVAIETFGEDGLWGWRFRIEDEPPVGLNRSPAMNGQEALEEAGAAARSVLDLRRKPV